MSEQEQPVTAERARDEDGKVQRANETPDKNEIICPLTHKLTGSAVNYDITWASTIDLGEGPGSWKSTPQKRGHSEAFYDEIAKMKEDGRIKWDANAYFFTHSQGVAAREKYEQSVLEGKRKANKRSWENRFEAFTGVSFEDLEKKFPELYKRATSTYISKEKKLEMITAAVDQGHMDTDAIAKFTGLDAETVAKLLVAQKQEKEEVKAEEEVQSFVAPSLDDVAEPTVDDIAEIEEEIEEAEAEEEVAPASAAAVAEIEADSDDDVDDHSTVVLHLSGYDEHPERMAEDTFMRYTSKHDVQYYEVELPGMEYPIFVPEGVLILGQDTDDGLDITRYKFVTED